MSQLKAKLTTSAMIASIAEEGQASMAAPFGKALVDQYARYVVPGYDFGAMRPTGDKVTRARPFAASAANGNVRLVRAPWLTDFLDEFSSFPESANHDDQVDSAVGAFTFLTGLGLPRRRKASILL